MSGNYKKQSRPFSPKPPQAPPPQVEELEEEEAKWNPTPEIFEAFLVRDEQLAAGNIRMVLGSQSGSYNLRGLKDSTLHSSETIERVLAAGVANGTILENKGRYSLLSRAALTR